MDSPQRLLDTPSVRSNSVVQSRSYSDDNKTVAIPHKALPQREGRLYWLHKEGGLGQYSYLTENEVIFNYSFLISHEIMYTDLAIKEGGYSVQPSVLVINSRYNPDTSKDGSLLKKLNARRESLTDKNFHPYGNKDHSSFIRGSMDFSENLFLRDIFVSASTGIHSLYLPYDASVPQVKRHLDAARKFFDIVLVDAHRNWEYYPEYGDKVVIAAPIQTGISGYSARLTYFSTLDGYIRERVMRSAEFPLADPEDVTFDQARMFSQDIARFFLGISPGKITRKALPIEPPSSAVERAKKVEQFMDRVKKRFHLPSYAFHPSILAAELLLFTPFLFLAYGLPLSTITGFLRVALTGYLVFVLWGTITESIASFVIWLAGRKEKKNFVEGHAVEPREEYPYLPVEDSPIAEAFNKEKHLAEIIERIDTGGQSGKQALLPLEAVELRIERVRERWAEYELDPVKALEFPMLLDAAVPTTAKFFTAFQQMNLYYDAFQEDTTKAALLVDAVTKTEEALLLAENAARKARLSYLSVDKQEKVQDARPLVAMATSDSSSPNERMNAWRRANKILEGVVVLPEKSVVGLLKSSENISNPLQA